MSKRDILVSIARWRREALWMRDLILDERKKGREVGCQVWVKENFRNKEEAK